MAEDTMVKKLTEKMTCKLCQEILFKPITLFCQHTFCNACLDEILTFQNDGSATLQCPDKCKGIVKIGSTSTVTSKIGSSSVDSSLQHVLDILKETKDTNLPACSACHSVSPIHRSCSSCGRKTCEACWEDHLCEPKISSSVIFDDRYHSFKAICEEHNAYVKNVCFDCENKFICNYCTNRSHKSHSRDDLRNQAVSTRESLSKHLDKTKQNAPSSNIVYEDEVKKIASFRELFEIELQERILKKLRKHAASLHKEKEKLLLQFDESVDQFKSGLDDFCLLENDFEKAFSLYTDKVVAKEDFEILSEMNEIIRQSESFASAHCFKATLKNGGDGNESSLGLLETDSFTEKSFLENNEIIQINYDKSCYNNVQKVEDLNYLLNYTSDIEASIQKTNADLIAFMRSINEIKSFSDVWKIINEDKIDCLKLLLKHQPDIIHRKRAKTATTLFHLAAIGGKDEALSLLLQVNDESINELNMNGNTALICATNKGHTSCIEILIEHHADINMTDKDGNTALILAANQTNLSCAKALIEHNADLNVKNNIGDTALKRAASKGDLPIVEIILKHNADIDIQGNNGNTALISAAYASRLTCVEILLKHNADINIKNNEGDRALAVTAYMGNTSSLESLIEHNADVNMTANDGNTALMFAAMNGHISCVKMLLQNNADINIKNNKGKTAHDLAISDEIKTILAEHVG